MKKDSYDFEAKRQYHALLRRFIEKHFPEGKRRRGLYVVCLPGHEGLEVLNVYDKLGIRRDRIWGIEHDQKAYSELESMGLGIQLYPGRAYNFFQKPPAVFDIINLDFQSQFKQEEAVTISSLFQKEGASNRCIFGTNFYSSRESRDRQQDYQDSITYLTSCGLLNQILEHTGSAHLQRTPLLFNALDDQREHLDDIRDKTISTGLRYLTSCSTIDESISYLIKATSHHWIANIAHSVGYESTIEEIMQNPLYHKDFILLAEGFLKKEVLEFITSQYAFDEGFRNCLFLFSDFPSLVRPRFICDYHKGKYVSDNGSPMLFDFLALNMRKDLTAGLEIKFGFDENHHLQRIVYQEGNAQSNTQPSVFHLGDSLEAKIAKGLRKAYESVEEALNRRGIFVTGDFKRFEQRTQAFTALSTKEINYIKEDRKLLEIKSRGEHIRDDLFAGHAEDEIKQRYDLTTQELAGHKAALTRENGAPLPSSKSLLYKPTFEEEEMIEQLIEQGIATDEMIMSSYNLTRAQLAARKAWNTRRKNEQEAEE